MTAQRLNRKSLCGLGIMLLLGVHLALAAAPTGTDLLLAKVAEVPDTRLRRFLTNSVKLGHITEMKELKQALQRAGSQDEKPLPPSGVDIQRVYKALQARESSLSATCRQAMAAIRAYGIANLDLYCGSHFVVLDGGRLYQRLSVLQAVPRLSSHYRSVKVQQYEVRLPGIGALLFGKTGTGATWFQLEAHSTSLSEAFPHVLDYIKHCLNNGDNVGPLGTSPRTESNPIIIADSRNQAMFRTRN